jgi:hypothetical protein
MHAANFWNIKRKERFSTRNDRVSHDQHTSLHYFAITLNADRDRERQIKYRPT